jgi:hypothetical protein
MNYLRELIERLGKALRIKTGPPQARQASAPTPPYGPVEGPAAQQGRR